MNRTLFATYSLILLSLLFGIMVYPLMPAQMVSHWNEKGYADGSMPKFWGIFLLPAISLFIVLLLQVIPSIDPLKKNIAAFRSHYDGFTFVMILFMSWIYALSIAWNLGYVFPFVEMLLPALGIVLFYAGILTENAKQNWFVGVRTPWTLSSEEVWTKTNALGGKLFKIAGIVALLGIFFPEQSILLLAIPLALAAFWLILYSYLLFRKIRKKEKRKGKRK